MSTKEYIRQILSKQEWVSNGMLAQSFRPGEPGFLSFSQRLRELRQDYRKLGGNIITRRVSKGTYEYKLVLPNQETQKELF